MKEIVLDPKKCYMKRYQLRETGARGSSIEITVPREVVEREARRLGIEAGDELLGVWWYDGFSGLFLTFEKKE